MFYEKTFDSLDIGLVLFEVAYGKPYYSRQQVVSSEPLFHPQSEQYQTTASLDPGASLSLILEDLGDVFSVQSWSVIFGWVERRAEHITTVSPLCSGMLSRSFLLTKSAL
jgi:hypothetical protein